MRLKEYFTTNYFYLIPIFCIFGVSLLPKGLQLVILMFLCFISMRKSLIKFDWFFLLQSIYLIICFTSIIFNACVGEHELSRVLAAFNTLLITIISLAVYNNAKNDNIESSIFNKAAFVNLFIIAILAIISRFNTPLNNIHIFGKTLVGEDWVNGQQTMRFYGFLDYSNLVVFMVLMLFPFAIDFFKRNRIMVIVLSIACLFIIYITDSRSGALLFLLLLLIYFIVCRNDRNIEFLKKNKFLIFITLTLIFIFVIAIFHNHIYTYYLKIMQMRTGSNSMRSFIYTSSINRMLSESPIIGIGIKDYLPNFGYPYGSHSTYLGVFYKAGIIGGIIYMASMVILFIRVIKIQCNNIIDILKKISIILILLLMCLEDIDGANWNIYFAYFIFGLFLSKQEQTLNDN